MPLTMDTVYQKNLDTTWNAGNGSAAVVVEPQYRAGLLAVEWSEGQKPAITTVSRFATRDYSVDLGGQRGSAASPEELRIYLQPTKLLPTDGIVKATADGVVKGARTELEKARAIYDWVVENTFRDAKTRGCGLGDVKTMLETGSMGGKCADINAVFVALARSQGIPARDIYGVRVADSSRGYKSLGKSGNITRAQHCRAEFYAAGVGWVPVDPGDVRKVMLEEEAGGLPLDHEKVIKIRDYLFGNWEMNWLAYNTAHDLPLPKSTKKPLGYFMYPQCETAEGRLDSLDPDNFQYELTARELSSV
ncbi:MAG: transglutaminase domain-containing protein [Burkholderiales bacterium]|nr:transglutaminase domain-containing protein [Burkholderiales bacterium]